MSRIKIFIAALLLVSLLIIVQPSAANVKASEITPPVPIVVFTQDKNNKILINHSFRSDSKIFIPMDRNSDSGFYVTIPGTT